MNYVNVQTQTEGDKKKEYVYEVYSGDKVVYIQRKKKKRTYFFVAY